jgi:glycosyltransferase involved in cell wall biosynthesis
VSISHAQRSPLAFANWQATVHHGLPLDLYEPSTTSEPYLVFIGRISREKRLDRAIAIAAKADLPLKIAAKVDLADRDYFETEVVPLLRHAQVEFVGEVNDARKAELLRCARALLFPIDWPEPFGLVMIEAMACGTPVIAWRCGSVPEIITPGENGYVVTSIDDAVAAVQGLDPSLRRRCRQAFEERFSARRMAREYLRVYERLLN